MKGTLLDATDRTWGLAKPSIRHVRNVSFSDNCGYVLNEWSQSLNFGKNMNRDTQIAKVPGAKEKG